MRVALICAVRLENQYLDEFISHYKALNFDSIILLDNNFASGDDDIYSVIDQADLSSAHVIVEDLRQEIRFPITHMFEVYYEKYHHQFDWIAFFDADEFLVLGDQFDNDVKKYLSQDCFKNKDSIMINWDVRDDNNLIYYDSRPCMERFTKPTKNGNWHVKSIISCRMVNNASFIDPHHIVTNNAVDANGNPTPSDWCNWNIDHTNAKIIHFIYKTIEECIRNRFRKHRDHIRVDNHSDFDLSGFFEINEKTDEKIQVATKLMKELYNYDLKL